VIGLVALGVVVALAIAAVAFVVLRDDDGGGLALPGVPPGPSGEPSERWRIDLGNLLDDDDDPDFVLTADAERVYLVTQTGSDDGTITAYDGDDGAELWQVDFDATFLSDDSVHAVEGHGLIVEGVDPDDDDSDQVRLYDFDDGEELWEVEGSLVAPFGYQITDLFAIRQADVVLTQTFDFSDDDTERTTTAVDVATGDELWDAEGSDGIICGDLVFLQPEDGEVVAHDIDTGDEVWDASGSARGCDGTSVIVDDGDTVSVYGPDGDETGSVELIDDPGDDGGSLAAVVDGNLLVTSFFANDDGGSDARAALYPLDGGDPLWEEDDLSAIALGHTRFFTTTDEGDEIQLFDSDGNEISDVVRFDDEGECDGEFTSRALISCSEDSADLTAHSLDDLEDLWTIDAGDDVRDVAAGGTRLFVLTDEDELVAFA